MEETFAPLEDQVQRIRALCERRASGSVVLLSDDNRMAQVHLRDGEIVFVLCRGRRGLAALEQLRGLRNVRLRLDGVVDFGIGPEMPPTPAILDYLDGQAAALPSAAGAMVAPPPTAAPAFAPRQAPAEPGGIKPAVQDGLRHLLARYIGPMAEIVFPEHSAAAQDARALVLSLLSEIDEPDQVARFKAEAEALVAAS